MAEAVLHPHVKAGMLPGPVHAEDRKVEGSVAGLPEGPHWARSKLERLRLERERTGWTCAWGRCSEP